MARGGALMHSISPYPWKAKRGLKRALAECWLGLATATRVKRRDLCECAVCLQAQGGAVYFQAHCSYRHQGDPYYTQEFEKASPSG
ncbi:hypothetical protein EVAR_23613_1 [Eumeta japonica]|uniref:Uncharacterized protein n=1 Tax=Eumeta variegata TaxID=151549 RepID=A0A4C1WZ19_EUMVA|nr:hypothetical protein EVAR_23613_1 [Eumeta japonica]